MGGWRGKRRIQIMGGRTWLLWSHSTVDGSKWCRSFTDTQHAADVENRTQRQNSSICTFLLRAALIRQKATNTFVGRTFIVMLAKASLEQISPCDWQCMDLVEFSGHWDRLWSVGLCQNSHLEMKVKLWVCDTSELGYFWYFFFIKDKSKVTSAVTDSSWRVLTSCVAWFPLVLKFCYVLEKFNIF